MWFKNYRTVIKVTVLSFVDGFWRYVTNRNIVDEWIMSDEAHFRKSVCVNRRNCRYRCHGSARVPSSFCHDEQCSAVWHISRNRGP
jgi:hypothetical protein